MTGAQRPGLVVVGAALAELRGAEALRDGGYDGPLTLVGDEPHRPPANGRPARRRPEGRRRQ